VCLGLYLQPSPAIDQDVNENVLVFTATGEIEKSFHVGDFTVLIDAAQIHYEDYNAGSPPSLGGTGADPYVFMPGERWVPNILSGQFPPPGGGGIPQVSLYSFGEALLPSPSSATPGVSLSPSPGAYTHSLNVEVKAFPPSAVVEIYNPSTSTYDTFGNSSMVTLVQSRSLLVRSVDGGIYSPVKQATYTIVQDATVDTDADGIPDLIEVLLSENYPATPFDPFISDAKKDSDGDGWTDLDEILRGADPDAADSDHDGWSDADETTAATDPLDPASHPGGAPPIYSPPLAPVDTDGDGWPDFDEALRGTSSALSTEYPAARWLYEVESITSGQFNGVVVCPTCERHLSVAELNGGSIYSVTVTVNTFSSLRTPRGHPSVLRMTSKSEGMLNGLPAVQSQWASGRYLPFLRDPQPGDIPSSEWHPAKGPIDYLANWLAAYQNLLSDTLVQSTAGLVVEPTDTAQLALMGKAAWILNRLMEEDGVYNFSQADLEGFHIVGRTGYSPTAQTLETLDFRLKNPVQKPAEFSPAPKDANEYQEILLSFSEVSGLEQEASDLYSSYTEGDLEAQLGQLVSNLNFSYLGILGLSLSLDEILATGVQSCLVLNPFEDADADMLANFVEALGLNRGRETNLFLADTDGDGIPDEADNCPGSAGLAADAGSNGVGDVCDVDDDGDGLATTLEDYAGTNPGLPDTDGDGWQDGAEYGMALDPSNPNDAIFLHGSIVSNNIFATQVFPIPVITTPLVLANPVTQNGGNSAIADLNTVAALSFQHKIDKDPGIPRPIVPERISYLAVHPTPPGWNQGRVNAGSAIQNIHFPVPFTFGTKPLVFAAIQTSNDPARIYYPEVTNISHTGFSLRVRGNASQSPPAGYNEDVAWVALTPSQTFAEGEAGSLLVDGITQTVSFSQAFNATPDLLASVEGVGTTVLVSHVTPSQFQVRLVNDAAAGGSPSLQRVMWFALGEVLCLDPDQDGVCSAVDNSPSIYNPDQVDTDTDGVGNVEDLDADQDGLPDAFEESVLVCGFAPFQADGDGDGTVDGDEDNDGDGFTNADEVVAGSDIFDASSTPLNTTPTPSPTDTMVGAPTATLTPTPSRTATLTMTPAASNTPTITQTPTITPTPGFYNALKLILILKNHPVQPEILLDVALYWFTIGPTPTPTP
jgi:hypothetical protein